MSLHRGYRLTRLHIYNHGSNWRSPPAVLSVLCSLDWQHHNSSTLQPMDEATGTWQSHSSYPGLSDTDPGLIFMPSNMRVLTSVMGRTLKSSHQPRVSLNSTLSAWPTTCHILLPRILPTAIITLPLDRTAVPTLVSLCITASVKPFRALTPHMTCGEELLPAPALRLPQAPSHAWSCLLQDP